MGVRPLKLLFVGQVETHKGIAWLISVWSEIRQQLGNVTLTVVGDGRLLSSLKSAIASDPTVIWLGRLTADEVTTVMKSHDVLVVPSLCYENSPVVIAEAYRVGLLVVGSCIGGLPELIPPARTFTPESVGELVNAISHT